MSAGWKAFGATPGSSPLRPPDDDYPVVRPCHVDFPKAELTNGVAVVKVEITGYGDDTASVFILVVGTDKDAVLGAYRRAELLMTREAMGIVFGGER